MERTMTIKKFFAPSTTRLGWQQGFRDVWQRLTMVLMLVMLTTATAWAQETMTVTAEDVTATYDGSGQHRHHRRVPHRTVAVHRPHDPWHRRVLLYLLRPDELWVSHRGRHQCHRGYYS